MTGLAAVMLLAIMPVRPPVVAQMPLSTPVRTEALLMMAQQVNGELRISGQYQQGQAPAGPAFVKSSAKALVCGGEDNTREWNATKAGPMGGWHCYMGNLWNRLTQGDKTQ